MRYSHAFLFVLLLASCKEDDTTIDPLSTIPSGEIVTIDQRDLVLTGINSSDQSTQPLKWWRLGVSVSDYTPDECGFDETITNEDILYSFAPTGHMLVKTLDADSVQIRTWKWSSSTKEAIQFDDVSELNFEVRALNDDEVVYAAYRKIGSCSVLIWERFYQ